MTKDLWARYYEKKQRKNFKKSLVKNTKILLKKKKIKSENMVVNVTRISQKINRGYLSIEKGITNCQKIIARSLNKVPGF